MSENPSERLANNVAADIYSRLVVASPNTTVREVVHRGIGPLVRDLANKGDDLLDMIRALQILEKRGLPREIADTPAPYYLASGIGEKLVYG
tara:strand:- start:166 stop:441 length:276 start_codon:yes stop_codon:yes gene_type:complete